ncbi:MAG: hypothetical protein HFJ40_01085 [Clostridia bacterium]|nr:hypothetical protein [Clostridia bacterium]
MNKNQKTKEKVCTFFASDYHFEMISLPYINKKIENNKEVIILTENNLENTIKDLISKMNLKESNRNKILNIDWKNDNLNKFKKIKSDIENDKEIVIFIKGKENYIKNINKNIEKWVENSSSTKIIDCYDIEEVGENLDIIMDKYSKILNTTGEKEIQKI